ncbi:MAG: glutathione S-transferase family protein [Alphaproteobacteria bacterium]|nr:glutathione S-transferase family protein [Alphaproteobacteria bacterium]
MAHRRIVWGVGTSRTIRAHWALAELGLEYETRPVRTRTPDTEAPEFVAVNPRGKIPVLRDGEVTIAESAAIVTWLGETYRDGRELVPQGGPTRARYLEWMSFICMELDATSLYVLRRHWSLPGIYGEAPVANAAAEGYFARMISAAEALYEPDRPYLLGDRFSGVDILMATTLEWAVNYNQPLPQVFDTYLERMSARPAFREACTANQAP